MLGLGLTWTSAGVLFGCPGSPGSVIFHPHPLDLTCFPIVLVALFCQYLRTVRTAVAPAGGLGNWHMQGCRSSCPAGACIYAARSAVFQCCKAAMPTLYSCCKAAAGTATATILLDEALFGCCNALGHAVWRIRLLSCGVAGSTDWWSSSRQLCSCQPDKAHC